MITLETKPGADVRDLHPAFERVQDTIGEYYAAHRAKAVITSGRDSRHSTHSAHGKGQAIDLRITKLFERIPYPDSADWWRAIYAFADGLAEKLEMAAILGNLAGRFDVVVEATPPHLHLEYSDGEPPNIKGWTRAKHVYATAEVREYMEHKRA